MFIFMKKVSYKPFLKEVSKKLNLNVQVFQKNIFEIKNLKQER